MADPQEYAEPLGWPPQVIMNPSLTPARSPLWSFAHLLLVLLAACDAFGSQALEHGPGEVHPVAEYRVPYRGRVQSIDINQIGGTHAGGNLSDTMRRSEMRGTFHPEQVVGEVHIAGNKQIFFLDARTATIDVTDTLGNVLQRLGGVGSGRGQLLSPISMATDRADNLYVGSLGHTLDLFEVSDAGYQFSRHISIDMAPRSMCFLKGHVIVAGAVFGDEHSVRIYDPAGVLLGALAVNYTSPNRLLNHALSGGKVACDETNDVIVFAPASPLGEIRAYRLDGGRLWTLVFENYIPIRILSRLPEGYTIETPSEGFHRVHGLSLVVPGIVLVQVARVSPSSRRDPQAILSLLVDTSSGTVVSSSTEYPPLAAVRGNLAVTSDAKPGAQLEIRLLEW